MWRFTLCMLLVTLSGSSASAQATFFPLPVEYGGSVFTATGISADGNVIAGHSASADALRWSSGGGFEVLGTGLSSAVSSDGSSVVGGFFNVTPEAFLWTESGGMLGLGMSLGGHAGSSATDVSDNGSVVVGNIGLTSFRWTASSGLVDLNAASAAAVSADGSTVVGTHAAPHGTEAYRWTQSGGIANLGFLPGQTQSFARDVSADGSVVVGHSGPGAMPFRWTDGLGMVALDTPCLVCNGYAIGVSSDGSIVVGGSETSAGVGFPFIWDEINGMRDIRQILVDEGIDLSGWTLGMPTGVSADGLTILGAGTNPSGIQNYWVASLPPPISVPTSNWFLMSLLALLLAATGFQAFQSTDFRSA